MYIAMNRFKVVIGLEGEFEEVWRGRDSRLSEVPGFLEFRLLRGKANVDEGYTLFSSHTTWFSEEDFINWTKSEHFRAAHRNAGDNKRLYWGPPQFEGFSVVSGI
ncbi:antibiotic biosynthesis monooxygenase [Rhizobium sp. AC27/96]|jgi:heme-degrading monooxygenase HmoA|uniref:antibiotic biosynthesis monooxygenase family protein n=1 Tax=Rhizobium TaxID=379 RepID=UPI0008292ECD|nr:MULTISPECIES: antibiotic biosynthesis monooxygenase [Rhizobium]NTF42880.1 antibiotic biosynthesis monooxygenase [Rhizobium rhizogenes]OCI91229.1 antibiotic biosynthesis monooxygenase [Rhizobium sp. AC27/96]